MEYLVDFRIIYQHLPRGSVWIQGMVYGHPLSSIQHPLEDPGINFSLSFLGDHHVFSKNNVCFLQLPFLPS